MEQLTSSQLRLWLDDPQRDNPVLIDVREPWEFDTAHIKGAMPMPMRAVPARYLELERERETVIICRSGARSYQVGMFLEQAGFIRVNNLYGGMIAWSQSL